jgi:SAM-dependent methyltransferase
MKNQNDIWKDHLRGISVEKVISTYENPAEFQLELKHIIEKYAINYKDVIEVGCETGVTNLILDDKFNKTYLDLNPFAVSLVEAVIKKLNKKGVVVLADMFNIPFDKETFDVVFNAGVIEHFNYTERDLLFKEYKRILRKKGVMIIAFPNHYSFPYRTAYLMHNYIFFGRWWPFPKEFKLYDLKKELSHNGLELKRRITTSKNSVFNWWSIFPAIKKVMMWLDKFFHFEGYLTILVISKQGSEQE